MGSMRHAFAWAGAKFTATVLDDIWPMVLVFSGVATMVVTVSKYTSHNLGVSNVMLTVLGTVVSLVVSFQTNNSYARWWDGRNQWSLISSNCRTLSSLIWIHVSLIAPPKEDGVSKEEDGETKPPPDEASSLSDIERKEVEAKKREWERMRGMVEKKTYIGLVEAFAVSMKHSLRGESGPFYTDLYRLIAFLPKYNPSLQPPILKEQLYPLWQNGIPRQKAKYDADELAAVPLTQAADFDGYGFAPADEDESLQSVADREKQAGEGEFTTTSHAFKQQALHSALPFFGHDENEEEEEDDLRSKRNKRRSHCFAKLDEKHRMIRRSEDAREKLAAITSVELMPPRHPPPARYWDFFPPLRIIHIVNQYFQSAANKEKEVRARGGKRNRAGGVRLEIPQELLHYLSAYVYEKLDNGSIQPSMVGNLMTCIVNLNNCMTELQKLATTPLPSAYMFHLHLSVFLWLFFLPFQLYPFYSWLTIPATAIAAITYLGFLEIGKQIEQPFGYDQSDLDLDRFVLNISRQLAEVTAFPHTIPASQIIMSHLNQPFFPGLSASAPDLLGVRETRFKPSTKGHAEAFAADPPSFESARSTAGSRAASRTRAGRAGTESPQSSHDDLLRPPRVHGTHAPVQPLITLRELEMTLNTNWQAVASETKDMLGRQRDQLENRTGRGVAVLTL